MNWRAIAEWLGFQVVWLTCALGAAQGRSAPGIVAAAVLIGFVLASRRWVSAEVATVIASGAVGLIVESTLTASGIVKFAAPWPSPHWAPAWIVALWLAFGTTVSVMAPLLGQTGRAFKASVVGALAGPPAYWAGARLGAIDVAGDGLIAYALLAGIWALALPCLIEFWASVSRGAEG